jgi:hypothetical protein
MIAEYKRYEYNHTKVKDKVEFQKSPKAMAFIQPRYREGPNMTLMP